MGLFILRRLGVMLLTALCLTFIVFWLTNLYPNLEKLAKTQGNFRMSDEAVTSYLTDRGYLQPLPVKFGQWLGVLPGWETVRDDGEVFGR
ncbi:MAG: peptide ABC transporter permease, partial [Rhodobacteraceae bacterium]|nr:peptide ABC transporter permease [Paracoccaceae bacterium]